MSSFSPFMNLSVGYPGRAHDVRVLAVLQRAQAGNLLPDWKKAFVGWTFRL